MLSSLVTSLLVTIFFGLVKAAGDEDVFELRPEIHHVFREEEKMPPAVLSIAFSFIILSPWLLLLIGWFKLGYTPSKVFLNLQSLRIAGFLGSIVAIEYLFYLYWTKINLIEMLPYFGALCLVAFITGQRALTAVQERRLK